MTKFFVKGLKLISKKVKKYSLFSKIAKSYSMLSIQKILL